MLDQLAQNTGWFNERGVRVAAVTMGKPYEAKMFCAQRSPDVVCLSNPDQSAYQEFNIGKINAQDVLNPAFVASVGDGDAEGFQAGRRRASRMRSSWERRSLSVRMGKFYWRITISLWAIIRR